LNAGHEMIGGEGTTELASNRTSLSFARTRMSADRTLMAIVRTAVSLIAAGFSVYQAVHQLDHARLLRIDERLTRDVGATLILIGVALLALGIVGYAALTPRIQHRRNDLHAAGLLRRDVPYRATPTLVAAGLLLLIGVAR
jgi:putative membrane protein